MLTSSSSSSILSRSISLTSSKSKPFSQIQIRNSHIGSSPLYLPASTTLTILPFPPHPNPNRPLPTSLKTAQTIQVKGPKGQLNLPLHDCVKLNWNSKSTSSTSSSSSTPSILSLSVLDPTLKSHRSIWGLSRALLSNAINGVSEGHSLILRMVGVGYRASIELEPLPPGVKPSSDRPQRQRISLRLGYSHPILMKIPEGIEATTPQPTRIVLKGPDKAALGLFASQIRQWRKPEPYKVSGWNKVANRLEAGKTSSAITGEGGS